MMKRTALATGALTILAMLAACGDGGDAGTAALDETQAADAAPPEESAPDGEAAAIDLPADADPATYNLAASQQYLADNARRAEVTLTPSGLQYEVWRSGPADGRQPGPEDWVCVNYTGMLPDGTVFDSNQGGQPLALQLFMVINGWQEGLALMAEGDLWRLYIPPEMGYGVQGTGGVGGIPPNAALVFDVELLRVMDTTEIAVLGADIDPSWNCADDTQAAEPDPAAPAD